MRHRRRLIALCVFLLALQLSASVEAFGEIQGPFRGQIVDSETGLPITGAVVLAVWNTLTPTPLGHGGQEFYDTREAVTGVDGRFEIPRLPVPFGKTDVQPPRLYFFAPGYVIPWPNLFSGPVPALAEQRGYGEHWKNVLTVTPPEGQRFVAPTVLRMRHIKTKEEWCRHRFYLPPLRRFMADKMTLMLEAIETEDRVRGGCN